MREAMEREPVQFLWRRYEDRLEPSRRALARFIGARPQDVVFVTNATTGVNAVIRSVRLAPGDEVLTTNLDYNACRNALAEAVAQSGARLVVASIPFPLVAEQEIADAVLGKVTRRTRLVMLDHVTSNTALVLPVERLVRELESRGVPALIDGAHAPGMIDLDLRELRPAYYTANLHKWVCAPKGAAFLWVREDLQGGMQPPVVSHGNNTPRPGYSGFQDRFDWTGTFDPTPWFCVGAVIAFMAKLNSQGWRGIRWRNRQLALAARQAICESLGLEPPCPASLLGSMATIPLPEKLQGRPKSGKIDPEQLRLYDDFKVEVPFVRVGKPQRRYLRVSAHLYNSMPDYERLSDVLRRLR